jgi:hypothetical protein
MPNTTAEPGERDKYTTKKNSAQRKLNRKMAC